MEETTAPYSASLIDRLNARIAAWAVPSWLAFAAAGLVLIAVQLIVMQIEGRRLDGDLLPVILFNSFFGPFLLALIDLLDRQAAAATEAMRPVLDMTAAEYERCRYGLANMPARPVLAAGSATLILVILTEQLSAAPARYAALELLPVFNAVFQIIDKSSAFLFGVFVYHTIRQLYQVTIINGRYIRLDLFNLTPLQGFSRLTATTAVGLIAGVYGWMVINPDLFSDPLILAFVAASTVLAAAVFILPLYGLHRQMERAKDRMLGALDRDFAEVFPQFNRAFHDGDQATLDRLNGTIASLEIQRNRILAFPTWPWKPETAQFALTAITLPLLLAVLQFLVERAID